MHAPSKGGGFKKKKLEGGVVGRERGLPSSGTPKKKIKETKAGNLAYGRKGRGGHYPSLHLGSLGSMRFGMNLYVEAILH